MESLYLLLPLSAGLVLAIVAMFAWAVFGGQFEGIEGEAERILTEVSPLLDGDQGANGPRFEESNAPSHNTEHGVRA